MPFLVGQQTHTATPPQMVEKRSSLLVILSSSNSWHHPLQSPDNRTSQDLAQYINTFFTGHSVPLTLNTPLEPDDTNMQLVVPPSYLVNIGQVYYAIRNIKINKSPGPDLMLNRILKIFAFELALVCPARSPSRSGEVIDCLTYAPMCSLPLL